MRIIFQKPMLDLIRRKIEEAEVEGKLIEKILLTEDEFRMLAQEIKPEDLCRYDAIYYYHVFGVPCYKEGTGNG